MRRSDGLAAPALLNKGVVLEKRKQGSLYNLC